MLTGKAANTKMSHILYQHNVKLTVTKQLLDTIKIVNYIIMTTKYEIKTYSFNDKVRALGVNGSEI